MRGDEGEVVPGDQRVMKHLQRWWGEAPAEPDVQTCRPVSGKVVGSAQELRPTASPRRRIDAPSWAGAIALILFAFHPASAAQPVRTADELVAAVENGAEGDTIRIGSGVFRLERPLSPKSGMTLRGAGMDATVITHMGTCRPSPEALPTPEATLKGFDKEAYLIRLPDGAAGVSLSDLTLRGPGMHGAIFGFNNREISVSRVRVQDFMANGIRTFGLKSSRILDCEFIDAGGRWKRGGVRGDDGGISGGAIFGTWTVDSEIVHNRFIRTQRGKARGHYGIKGRQFRRTRIHHNTIAVNFAIELPFENDEDVEIDHNVCHGAISIPKHAGGPAPESGRTFHIHHNYFTTSYAIEFVRNGVEIDHNLFDFDVREDGGNLISGFGKAPAKGPAIFHNNLVNNPGRGVIWINEPYDNLTVRNNHIVTRLTVAPRTEGLFGFHRDCDFETFRFTGNVIECRELPRPLFRNEESQGARIEGNRFVNVSGAERFGDQGDAARAGLEEPLKFRCGARGESKVDGWRFDRNAGARPSGR